MNLGDIKLDSISAVMAIVPFCLADVTYRASDPRNTTLDFGRFGVSVTDTDGVIVFRVDVERGARPYGDAALHGFEIKFSCRNAWRKIDPQMESALRARKPRFLGQVVR